MEIIADLHLHSKYSRAVSQQMVVSQIAFWAAKKGINLVGTADWTHPLWLRELKESLEEAGEGIYKLKSQIPNSKFQTNSKFQKEKSVCFLLATEIASIYSQGGKVRRIHNLVLAPSFAVVEKINEKLRHFGVNLLADGRPITGLSGPQLCELIFSVDKNCLVIPAHAWTPWFSLYGANSGFDSIEECFGKYTEQIYAIETGLSSDPAMNWRIKELDKRAIVSFSDAHSPQKLGREATVFAFGENKIPNSKFQIPNFSFRTIVEAIKKQQIAYTIEFYPEEGKYHYTGHRNCGVRQSPEETRRLGETCPVCGKRLTVGVMHRVEKLSNLEMPASRDSFGIKKLREKMTERTGPFGVRWIGYETRPPYVMLVPLMEILAEALGTGVSSQNVLNEYNKLTEAFGSEFGVLLKTPLEEIAKISGKRVAEGIEKVRRGEIVVEPGYDGVFGTVKIWPESKDVAKVEEQGQMSLF
jgi:uncharacterized protein (TIGR00375 family)